MEVIQKRKLKSEISVQTYECSCGEHIKPCNLWDMYLLNGWYERINKINLKIKVSKNMKSFTEQWNILKIFG